MTIIGQIIKDTTPFTTRFTTRGYEDTKHNALVSKLAHEHTSDDPVLLCSNSNNSYTNLNMLTFKIKSNFNLIYFKFVYEL
jgi:hypothetical protein